MAWYNIVSLIVSILAIPSVVGLFWKDLHDKKREESVERKAKKKAEERENIKEVLNEVLEPIKVNLSADLKTLNKKVDLVSSGTLSSLRNDILKDYYICRAKGYRSDYDFSNMHSMYKSYSELGGNSFVSDIMERFDSLPTQEEYEENKRKEEEEQKNKNNTRTKGVTKKVVGGVV